MNISEYLHFGTMKRMMVIAILALSLLAVTGAKASHLQDAMANFYASRAQATSREAVPPVEAAALPAYQLEGAYRFESMAEFYASQTQSASNEAVHPAEAAALPTYQLVGAYRFMSIAEFYASQAQMDFK